jgi:Tfp pilus assembly protein PilX
MATTRRRDEQGSAMVITLMVLALVTALSTTVAVVTIDNLQSSWRAQQAGAAVNAADAGIAQAMSYLRSDGVRDLDCSPSCAANPWGNSSAPTSVAVAGVAGQAYTAWIEVVAAFPDNDPGLYRIHAIGTATGAASREVSADVSVTTATVPTGVFARTINGGGDASVARESIFSTGCVYNRSKIQMTGTDLVHGIPVAVHSSQIITDSNGTGQYCPTTSKPIHDPAKPPATRHCNTAYPYDQDRFGGSLAGTLCATAASSYPDYYGSQDLDGDGAADVDGSLIEDDDALFARYGIQSPALDQARLDQLKTVALSQGNYWTTSDSTVWSSPDEDNAVMFFDLAATDPGGVVDLNDIVGFGRDPNLTAADAACLSKSLIIVIEGGNTRLNSNQQLFASVFLTSSAPYGQVFKANGTSEFVGTLYADTVNLTGTADLSMDECFLSNVSPAMLDWSISAYREIDR